MNLNSVFLGQRVEQRRRALKLTLVDVATTLQIKYATIWRWEKRLPEIPRSDKEKLWEQALHVPSGWIRDISIPTPDPRLSPNWVDYIALGRRAHERRLELGISGATVSRRIGLSLCRFYLWERSLPIATRGKVERRLEKALMVPEGWLRNVAIPTPIPPGRILPNGPARYDLTAYSPKTVAEEIRLSAMLLAQGNARFLVQSYEKLAGNEKMRATLFASRYGVNGPNNVTLQSCGDIYGLTRERVRQIIKLMKSQAHCATIVAPIIATLKELVENTSITSVSELESTQRALLGKRLSLTDAKRFAVEILGTRFPRLPNK